MAAEPPSRPAIGAEPATPAAATAALICPACGGALALRAAGYTVSVACQYCASILDVTNPDVRLITRYEEAVQQLEIPLGTRGRLRDIEWEAIGYLRRSERGSYGWEEYLLFNPYHGYRWLVTNGRGWSFGETLTRAPHWNGFSPQLDGHAFTAFFRDGQAQVDYVIGEFYWRVQIGEEVGTDDYVRPGWMLSREANASEISWSLSQLLTPDEIEAGFGVTAPRDGWPPLPHQPSPYLRPLKTGAKIFGITAALLLLASLIFGGHRVLMETTLPVMMSSAGQTQSQTLGPIIVTRPYQLVAIRAAAPGIDNAWVDVDYTLVDRATEETYEAYSVAEHYSGSDSDGRWQEGSGEATAKVAGIPAGTYDLVVEYSGNLWGSPSPSAYDYGAGGYGNGASGGRQATLQIQVSEGLIFPSNIMLALALLLLPLLYLLVRHIRFEKARQEESDAGPSGLAALFRRSNDD